jgi:hypothetical protein
MTDALRHRAPSCPQDRNQNSSKWPKPSRSQSTPPLTAVAGASKCMAEMRGSLLNKKAVTETTLPSAAKSRTSNCNSPQATPAQRISTIHLIRHPSTAMHEPKPASVTPNTIHARPRGRRDILLPAPPSTNDTMASPSAASKPEIDSTHSPSLPYKSPRRNTRVLLK